MSDFEKCCKTHIYLQKSVPIQPKTSNILPKFCQKLATTLRVRGDRPTANPRDAAEATVDQVADLLVDPDPEVRGERRKPDRRG